MVGAVAALGALAVAVWNRVSPPETDAPWRMESDRGGRARVRLINTSGRPCRDVVVTWRFHDEAKTIERERVEPGGAIDFLVSQAWGTDRTITVEWRTWLRRRTWASDRG